MKINQPSVTKKLKKSNKNKAVKESRRNFLSYGATLLAGLPFISKSEAATETNRIPKLVNRIRYPSPMNQSS